ncbi:hypothetical protein FHS59_000164 [Algoriphagus iocasae]|uniref:Uncharacterized protein n=1 Tax=Algoriphagus iocasae TaxID=1836499 RepID=A0A841MGU3_9BACT|nr:hypothetical protein [Algoriphagus iocasae]MBB6324549.1 hypothetical protein [Algoriphagus iocasae]
MVSVMPTAFWKPIKIHIPAIEMAGKVIDHAYGIEMESITCTGNKSQVNAS